MIIDMMGETCIDELADSLCSFEMTWIGYRGWKFHGRPLLDNDGKFKIKYKAIREPCGKKFLNGGWKYTIFDNAEELLLSVISGNTNMILKLKQETEP